MIHEGNGEAVYLQLTHQVGSVHAEKIGNAAIPGGQFFRVEGVGQTEHGQPVFHLGETLRRRRTHPLSGRLRRHQIRMLVFQLSELAHQRVELGVGYLRGVQRVVTIVVAVYLLAELVYALLNLGVHSLWSSVTVLFKKGE